MNDYEVGWAMAKGVRPLLCKLRGCKARRWPPWPARVFPYAVGFVVGWNAAWLVAYLLSHRPL